LAALHGYSEIVLHNTSVFLAWLTDNHISKPNVMLGAGRTTGDTHHKAKPERPKTAAHVNGNCRSSVSSQLSSWQAGQYDVVITDTTECVAI
jgi:hypothetical protein